MTVLDVCCGGRQSWFDKEDSRALFLDNRTVETTLYGQNFSVSPDIVSDFINLPFPDDSFPLVVFDPPHLRWAGNCSVMRIKYGQLLESWSDDIQLGFQECFRVLRPLGTLVFKWSEAQIKVDDVISLSPVKPLFGNRRDKTIWVVFQKPEGIDEQVAEQGQHDHPWTRADGRVLQR